MGRTRLRGICIGGLQIGIEVPPGLPWDFGSAEEGAFGAVSREPDVSVGVRLAPVAPARRPDLSRAARRDRVEVDRTPRGWRVLHRYRGVVEREARFDHDLSMGEIRVQPGSPSARRCSNPLGFPLDEWLVRHRLALEGGLMLRGCGAVRDGRATVLAGAGGSERRTAARWLAAHPGVTLLSDCRVALRAEATGFRAHPTPWGAPSPAVPGAAARLEAVYALAPASTLTARPLTGAEAVAALVAALAPLEHPAAGERALATLERLAERVPVVRLGIPAQADRRLPELVWGEGSALAGRLWPRAA